MYKRQRGSRVDAVQERDLDEAMAAFEYRTKFSQLLRTARNHDLDLASLSIANPALQSAEACLTMDQPAEANPLHAAFDNVVRCV